MTVLVFGIHPDDIELSCGGTVVVAAASGHDVVLADLSDGAASSNGTVDDRLREADKAAGIMGVSRRINLGLPDTRIESENPEHVRRVVGVIREIAPRVVLAPSHHDPHPDHCSGGRLIERALYLAGVAGYEPVTPPWSVPTVLVYGGRREVDPHVAFDITAVHKTKMRAIRAHESQFSAGPGRKDTVLNAPDFLDAIDGRDRACGLSIRVKYGEAFRLLKPLAATDFSLFEG